MVSSTGDNKTTLYVFFLFVTIYIYINIMATKKITLNELRSIVKRIIKEEIEQYICWDAGGGNYGITKYNPKVSWHNDSDVFKGTYDECLRHKEESEEDSYRFRHNMPHKSWGDDVPDR